MLIGYVGMLYDVSQYNVVFLLLLLCNIILEIKWKWQTRHFSNIIMKSENWIQQNIYMPNGNLFTKNKKSDFKEKKIYEN